MAFLPPGGLSEIVFSFDTTGSMSSMLDEIRGRLQDMIQRLQADVPGIRFAVIAHGDYCDAEHFYVTKHIDFTTNIADLCEFVREVGGTAGGDIEECYELVLRMVRTHFTWTPGSQRALVMIGDAWPHEPDYPQNTDNIDWRDEAKALHAMGTKIYAVQAASEPPSAKFFQALADATGGHHIKLGDFSNICDFIMAICYRERDTDMFINYEAEVRDRAGPSGLTDHMEGLFGTLRRGDSDPDPALLKKIPSFNSVLSDKKTNDPIPKPKADSRKKARATPRKKAVAPKAKTPTKTQNKTKQKGQALKKKNVKNDTKAAKPKSRISAGIKLAKRPVKNRKLLREKVTSCNFALNHLNWSAWKPILRSKLEPGSRSSSWVKRNGGGHYREIKTFNQSKKAIIELSVQVMARTKRHVVFYKLLNHGGRTQNVVELMLRQKGVRAIVDGLMVNPDCVAFIRYTFPYRRFCDSVRKVGSLYDYAWLSDDGKVQRQRPILKHGVVIS